jgi:hypothetical protein
MATAPCRLPPTKSSHLQEFQTVRCSSAAAVRQQISKSELFRQMVNAYKAKLEEEEFLRLQNKMARRVRIKRVFTEKEVERMVFADR